VEMITNVVTITTTVVAVISLAETIVAVETSPVVRNN
jgi:hypothetical protein